jgi:hypothetical protein
MRSPIAGRKQVKERLSAATTMSHEMDMRVRLGQAEAELRGADASS